MAAWTEKRKSIRLNVVIEIVYSKKPRLAIGMLSLTKNIGRGGLCLTTYENVGDLKDLQALELRIFLPQEEEPVNAVGRVIWLKQTTIKDDLKTKRFDIGIQFTNINEEDREKIGRYVENQPTATPD